MLNPQPKEKIVEIIDRILAFQAQNNVNVFELTRIKHEVNRLLKNGGNNIAQCHMALGLIACFLGKRVETEYHQKNATLLEPGEPIHFQNYAIACATFGSFRQVIESTGDLVNRFGNVKTAMLVAIRQMISALQIERAEAYLTIYQKLILNDGDDGIPKKILDGMNVLRNTFNKFKVTDAHAISLLETAVETVRGHGHEVLNTSSQHLSSGEIVYYLYLDVDIATCTEENFHIADALVSKFEDSGMDYLSIVCRSLSHVDISTLKGA
jgi:hypothetical protein